MNKIILIIGNQGIGKTKLANQFKNSVEFEMFEFLTDTNKVFEMVKDVNVIITHQSDWFDDELSDLCKHKNIELIILKMSVPSVNTGLNLNVTLHPLTNKEKAINLLTELVHNSSFIKGGPHSFIKPLTEAECFLNELKTI